MMSLCINFRLFSLVILLRNQIILGANVTVTEDDTVCVGNNITVTCKIDPFTTPPSATWNRNGAALTTCTSGGICTTDSLVLNGIKYSFFGGPNDIQVSLQVQQVENGIQWNCDYDGKTYPYTFTVLNECTTTTTMPTTTPTTPATTPTTPTTTTTPAPTTPKATTTRTPSKSQNTCIFFKEKSCALNNFILAIIVLFFIALLFVIGYLTLIKGKRKQRKPGNGKKRNNPKEQELQNK